MGSSKGFTIVEQGHIVQMLIPQVQTAALTSESFTMKNWGHATIIIHGGAGSACTVTLFDAATAAASGASMVFNYATEATGGGDVMDAALQAATTAGTSLGVGTGVMLVIEIDNDELRDGYPWVLFRCTASGDKDIGASAILSGGRYMKDITATAIA